MVIDTQAAYVADNCLPGRPSCHHLSNIWHRSAMRVPIKPVEIIEIAGWSRDLRRHDRLNQSGFDPRGDNVLSKFHFEVGCGYSCPSRRCRTRMSNLHTSLGPAALLVLFRGKTATHCVFRHIDRNQKLQQIVVGLRPAANARHLVATKRMTLHKCTGDLTIQIQVTHFKLIASTSQRLWTATVDASRQSISSVVGD